jgi:TonB family protein
MTNFRVRRASFTIYFHMGSFRPVAIAIATCLALTTGTVFGSAQSAPEPKDSAKISSATVPDEQAFAGYERVSAGTTPPTATHSPDPEYPDVPADTEPRGVVVMLIGVDKHGHVGPVHVVRSSAPVFEKSAVTTVKTWRFKPAKKDGKPVPVQITVEMNFAK